MERDEVIAACPEFFEEAGPDVGRGWYPIIHALVLYIKGEVFPWNPIGPEKPARFEFRFTQIKEKFGGLRLYYTLGGVSDPDMCRAHRITGAIHATESISVVTCETCGAPGVHRSERPWKKVACDKCNAEWLRDQEAAALKFIRTHRARDPKPARGRPPTSSRKESRANVTISKDLELRHEAARASGDRNSLFFKKGFMRKVINGRSRA